MCEGAPSFDEIGKALLEPAIHVARATCKENPKGCGGPWCRLQANIRNQLDNLNIKWREEPKDAQPK